MSDHESDAILFGVIAGGAALAFAAVAAASASRKTARVDRAVERHAHLPKRRRAGRAARGVAPLIQTYTMVPIAIATSAYVLSRPREGPGVTGRSRGAAAGAITASAIVGALVEPAFDHFLPQPPLPRGRTRKRAVFPSGHTFKPTALALTCAHVLSREGLVSRSGAFRAAVVLPVVGGVAKLVSRKHWLSDVLGGAFAGVAIGSLCCASYEVTRGG